MAPRLDLNLDQQPDDFEEAGAEEAPEGNVMPEQRPLTSPGSTDDDEGIIPFRTSKRLQGAIYRMIQQRDWKSQDNNTPGETQDRCSAATLPPRKVKRQPESLSSVLIDVGKPEDTKTRPINDIVKEVGCDLVSKDVGSVKRKRKSFTVHFADPLFAYIDDEKEAASKLLSMSDNNHFLRARHTDGEALVKPVAKRSTTHAVVNKQKRTQPMSCFDLLCNHVGPRGWRCYRSSVEGKSFCRIHESRKTSSFESGISQPVRT